MTTPWARPRFVLFSIVAYCLVHFIVRLAMWHTLGIDDAEQALFAQDFSWSYRVQAPPLFTWILIVLGKVLGINIVAISIIRYVLLGIIFVFAYSTARRLIRDSRLSALAVYSFAAIYMFAFYSHHDLTHTTIMTAMLAVSWYVFVRLVEKPSLGWYLVLGASFGLGLLGKWNFVMFAAALPLACLLCPAYRRFVLTWKAFAAGLICIVIVLPTVIATLQGPSGLHIAQSVLVGTGAPSYVGRIAEGASRLVISAIAYPQPLLILMALVFAFPLLRGMRSASPTAAEALRRPDPAFLALTMAISLALHFGLVLGFGAKEFHERLMQPALFILPVYLFMLIERGIPSVRTVNAFALIVALLVLAGLIARVGVYLIGADYCGSCRNMVPFKTLAGDLRAAGFSGAGTIMVDGFHIGGNMRVEFPTARVIDAGYPPDTWPEPAGRGDCLLLWQIRSDRPEGSALTGLGVQSYLTEKLSGAVEAPHRDGVVSASMFHSGRQYRLGYRLYDQPVGDCR
jgi:4-amino-4-deoxy-L-arabinose transferase-like glycosyltransferase